LWNNEERKKYMQRYYYEHKEKMLGYSKRYYEQNKKRLLHNKRNKYRIKLGLKSILYKGGL